MLHQKLWYEKKFKKFHPLTLLLLPISFLYTIYVILRRFLYKIKIFKQHQFSVPVIVVGNITVGGTGKTPLIIFLAEFLRQQGFRPGIVSRGYKGKQDRTNPIWVNAGSLPEDVGDEPVLLAKRLFCPIVVCTDRVKAVQALVNMNTNEVKEVDVILSDDGLQHYPMGRKIEIVVEDGVRGFGNGFCLPAGPLREPISRMKSVDCIVVNRNSSFIPGNENNIPEKSSVISKNTSVIPAKAGIHKPEFIMNLRPRKLYNPLNSGEYRSLASFQGETVHAIAGTGNPHRFFQLLENHGLNVIPHPFPDHHIFKPEEIAFNDGLCIMMTEKDAVKCFSFMKPRHWVLAVDASLDASFNTKLLSLLKEKKHG